MRSLFRGWSAWGETGLIEDRNDYPLNYTIAGHAPATVAVEGTPVGEAASSGRRETTTAELDERGRPRR